MQTTGQEAVRAAFCLIVHSGETSFFSKYLRHLNQPVLWHDLKLEI